MQPKKKLLQQPSSQIVCTFFIACIRNNKYITIYTHAIPLGFVVVGSHFFTTLPDFDCSGSGGDDGRAESNKCNKETWFEGE